MSWGYRVADSEARRHPVPGMTALGLTYFPVPPAPNSAQRRVSYRQVGEKSP
jgi:hypothetical protein